MDNSAQAQAVLNPPSFKQEEGLDIFAVRQLQLSYFRSYTTLNLSLSDKPVILIGENGAGKTNILEAISFLAPGRGLRNAKLSDVDFQDVAGGYGAWAVATALQTPDGDYRVGTGRDPAGGQNRVRRIVKVDGELIRGQAELAAMFSVIWLTPQMDQLFLAASSDRRKFLDRVVYHFDPSHAKRVNDYEHAMRERARLLQSGQTDPFWFSTLEQNMASLGVAIAVARLEAVQRLQHAIQQSDTPFPKAQVTVKGEVESWLETESAIYAEERFLQVLSDSRQRDRISGRTNTGTHRSDLQVVHAEKAMPAALCSTGEQKALLLSIVLAEARARTIWRGSVPVLLLDEVVAHLDKFRREALFKEIKSLRAQAWMTGTDRVLFEAFESEAQFNKVKDGKIQPFSP